MIFLFFFACPQKGRSRLDGRRPPEAVRGRRPRVKEEPRKGTPTSSPFGFPRVREFRPVAALPLVSVRNSFVRRICKGESMPVIPAQAGIQLFQSLFWMPDQVGDDDVCLSETAVVFPVSRLAPGRPSLVLSWACKKEKAGTKKAPEGAFSFHAIAIMPPRPQRHPPRPHRRTERLPPPPARPLRSPPRRPPRSPLR